MTKFWAIESTFLARYRKFQKTVQVSAEQIAQYSAEMKKLEKEELVVVNGVAVIDVFGSLRNGESFYSWLFGGNSSSYNDIIEQLNTAEVNPAVEKAQLRVNSPGGRVDGLFSLLYRIKSFSKPIESFVLSRADSAAYGIVSQTDRIVTENEMSEVGSVGVGVSIWVDEEIVDITSSDAPNKWPDVTKSAGVDVVKSELDEIHGKFAGIIAEGRAAATGKAISMETVNANFGQGGTMLAEAGLAADMVDEVIPAPGRVSNSDFFTTSAETQRTPIILNSLKPGAGSAKSPKKPETEKTDMDIAKLLAEHPAVYKEVFEKGVAEEKDRVSALLTLGKSSGMADYAAECIENGKKVTEQTVTANFLSGTIKKADVDSREQDDPDTLITPGAKDKKTEEEAEVAAFVASEKKKAGVA